MGPKKEVKNNVMKREYGVREASVTLDDPLDSDTWKCVVIMAVEKSFHDRFFLKEFEEEATKQKRPTIKLITYTGIIKLVNDFVKGEVSHKHAFFINFSPLFLEAGEYITSRSELPVRLLVKMVKAMLLYLKEEMLTKNEIEEEGPVDPVKEMAERPLVIGVADKRKEFLKKGEAVGMKVRPPSLTKRDTELLKRGEGVKTGEFIQDAPTDGYYNMYVLLTEFYTAELPEELILAGVPLHGLICIDTTLIGLKLNNSNTLLKLLNKSTDFKPDHIIKFWSTFLRLLWSPDKSSIFRDVIFQVYTPRKAMCDKKERLEFIYREISYLMYDMSGYKRQLVNYLANVRLRDVEEKTFDTKGVNLMLDDMPNECVTVPIILQFIVDAICRNDISERVNSLLSSDFEDSFQGDNNKISPSLITRYGSYLMHPDFSREIIDRGDMNGMNIYKKTKALDVYYKLVDLGEIKEDSSTESSTETCRYLPKNSNCNLQEILDSSGSALKAIRRRYKTDASPSDVDYNLYSILMTRVTCLYEDQPESIPPQPSPPVKSSDFELIQNMEIRKPQFTVTDGSRHVLKSIPFNVKETSKDFFSPLQFKIVSPEKLKASSVPGFRVTPAMRADRSVVSDVLPFTDGVIQKKDLFLGLGEFLREDLIAKTRDFNCLEVYNRSKILHKETELQSMYNCIDYTYSLVHDAIFVAMHKRIDDQNSQYETFNEVLRTGVGLRDFFDYVLEDECDWFKTQEETLRSLKTSSRKPSQINCLHFTDSDFWLVDSIKYQFWKRGSKASERGEDSNEQSIKSFAGETPTEYAFEGYDISDTAVQFSGMKTVFHSDDCSITVELIERLYGDQVLGVHISQNGHVLHLYSYACPEPHIRDPFTFHLTFRNGIVVAFEKRFTEIFDEIEEIVESRATIKTKRNSSSEVPTVRRKISKAVEDEKFWFNMAASLPNGLTIRTVRGLKPCHIKQRMISHPEEACRLFLPNGDVVKMMKDNTVQIFKIDTSIVKAELNQFVKNCSKYEIVNGEGLSCMIENGKMTSSVRLQVLRNTDVYTNQVFFRRRDGTDYLLQADGTLCIKFTDGTKIRSCPYENDPVYSTGEDKSDRSSESVEDITLDYVIIHLEITVEHPDYATTIYNTKQQQWKLRLPYDSEITIHSDGEFHVNIDQQTELDVRNKFIEAVRFSTAGSFFRATADLSVFDHENNVYVSATDSTGKTFIIESNSNCYLDDVEPMSESDLPSTNTPTGSSEEADGLSQEKKYFVVRQDMSGFELLQERTVAKMLTELQVGSVVFTQTLPDSNLRCFVLITPKEKKRLGKWEVRSIIPDPKYVPSTHKQMTSTTYGDPPSWMHPFPKRKAKFQIPQCLSCRVFLETRPTELTPVSHAFQCSFCEADEVVLKHTIIKPTAVQDYLRKLSNDNQNILREMYAIVAARVINKKKGERLPPSEKLEHYLKQSKYYVEMQEYHKRCIRYRIVPNFFQHPAGISWLILNGLVDKLKLPRRGLSKIVSCFMSPPITPTSKNSSLSEIEYNLSVKTLQSFSSLSYHSSKSGETAPEIIETQGVCRCKVRPARNAISFSCVDYRMKDTVSETSGEVGEFPRRICDFRESDIELLDNQISDREDTGQGLTLEDLMCLGLV